MAYKWIPKKRCPLIISLVVQTIGCYVIAFSDIVENNIRIAWWYLGFVLILASVETMYDKYHNIK